jgi:hypothetical protein
MTTTQPTDLAQPQPEEHRMADTWRDCVVVCSCGWRTARKTMGAAKKEWVEHAADKRFHR